nr:amino acid racemase [Rhizobiaceae bacterium]
SARIVMHSVDFAGIELLQHEGDWAGAAAILGEAAAGLAAAGASFLVIATNTMHKIADEIEAESGLPVLHIADPTGAAIRSAGHKTVGLLATRFTMEEDFYRSRLERRYGLNVILPDAEERADVHRIIYEELCRGVVSEPSRLRFRQIIDHLHWSGAQAVILGCTEITLLVGQKDSRLPVFDTTAIHARAAVNLALGSGAPAEPAARDAQAGAGKSMRAQTS